jgi:hypothetical protein
MPCLVLHVVLSFFLDLAHVLTCSRHDQALELALLRQQLRLYERQATKPRPPRWEKVALASLAAKLPDLSRVCLVFGHAAALASRDRQAEVDLRPPPETRVAAGLGGVCRAPPAVGAGESPLGLRQAPR